MGWEFYLLAVNNEESLNLEANDNEFEKINVTIGKYLLSLF